MHPQFGDIVTTSVSNNILETVNRSVIGLIVIAILPCRCTRGISQNRNIHVVLMPVRMSARCAWLELNTIDHISVSISASASASVTGAATLVSTVMADAHDGKVDVATDNQEPVVYAEAASNGGYQHGSPIELV